MLFKKSKNTNREQFSMVYILIDNRNDFTTFKTLNFEHVDVIQTMGLDLIHRNRHLCARSRMGYVTWYFRGQKGDIICKYE